MFELAPLQDMRRFTWLKDIAGSESAMFDAYGLMNIRWSKGNLSSLPANQAIAHLLRERIKCRFGVIIHINHPSPCLACISLENECIQVGGLQDSYNSHVMYE